MDRNLRANHRFRLNEDSASNGDGKLYVFVKLTDSCMRTIETCMKQNKKHSLSNIKFNSAGGEISIPINAHENKTYSFQVSLEDKTPEVFQCIKQINRDQLENCGVIEQRIVIQAQDDVYSMTKVKVTEFQKNEELTKKQTKEIGESSKSILQKKTNKSSNQRASLPTTSKPKARLGNSQEERLSPTATTSNSSADRPLRERLVHLLAARTYRKPDLIARLKSDGGIRDEERDQLDHLLSTIASQSKNGEFLLLKNVLLSGDVNCDWPFYPKVEASTVRKKIKDLQSNSARSNAPKPNTESASSTTRTSTVPTRVPTVANPPPKPPSLPTHDDRPAVETEETVNPLSDERMQQLSEMLDKLSNAISTGDKGNDLWTMEMDSIDDEDLDEVDREYHRLVPEYNQLIDYLQQVSRRFLPLQQQFTEEQSHEKATRIVEEFFQCENNEDFLQKRQRVFQLHHKLTHLQKLLQGPSRSNSFRDDDEDREEEEIDDD